MERLAARGWKQEIGTGKLTQETDPESNRSLTDSQLGYPGLMPLRPKPTMSARADSLDTGARLPGLL